MVMQLGVRDGGNDNNDEQNTKKVCVNKGT